MAILVLIGIVAFLAYRATTPEEHRRFLDWVRAEGARTVRRGLERTEAEREFDGVLREQRKRAVAALALLLLNGIAFVVMSPSRNALGAEALVSWGASFGPRTTNGEWWRLFTSLFVEPGALAFALSTVCLLAVGRTVERLVGVRAFAATYLTAGVLTGVSNMAGQPIAVTCGSAGAVLGLFGLVAGSYGRGRLGPVATPIPLVVMARLGPLAVVLFLQAILSAELTAWSAMIGFFAGTCAGLALTREPEAQPSRRGTLLLASAAAVALVLAFSVHTITDVRPVIGRLAPLEARTSAEYETARRQFQSGRATPASLITIIEQSILPELRAEQTRIGSIEYVPREHEALIRDAADYLRHRTKSWELRVEGLRALSGPAKRGDKTEPVPVETRAQGQARHTANLMILGRAETEERAALEMLQRLTTASS